MNYDKQLFKSIWFLRFKIGKLLVRSNKLPIDSIKEYIVTISMGVASILLLPIALLYLLWYIRPKFLWFRGSKEELESMLKDRDDKRKSAESFANALKD